MTREVEQAIRQELAEQVGQERFELWFERFDGPRLHGESLRVTACDSFSLDWIRRTFHGCLRDIALRHQLELQYEVDATARHEQTTADIASESPSGSNTSTAAGLQSPLRLTVNSLPPCDYHEQSDSASCPPKTEAGRGRIKSEMRRLVMGDHNRMALASAQHGLAKPGEISPLFVHGPTGSGKTHLLQALQKDAFHMGRGRRCLLLSAEQFTSEYVDALKGHGLPNFRAKNRGVDLFLLDDLHFLIGKPATIVEFQHTLDQLLRDKRQVVLTSNRLPGELSEFGSDLIARLSSGVVCGLEYPEGEAKQQLILSLAEQKDLTLESPILDFLLSEIPGDARLVQGALNRLWAMKLTGTDVLSLSEVRERLRDLIQTPQRSVGLREVEDAVCDAFGIDQSQLRSPNKSRQISQPRMLAMWLARKHTRAALSEIGDHFGGRSHSTVIAAQRTVTQWVEFDKELGAQHRPIRIQDAIRRIERRLNCG